MGGGDLAGSQRGSKRPSQQELKLSAISDLEQHVEQLQKMLRAMHEEREQTDAELELARVQIAALEREAADGARARAELAELAAERDELQGALAAAKRERDAARADGDELRSRAQELLERSEEQATLLRTQTAVPASRMRRFESSASSMGAEAAEAMHDSTIGPDDRSDARRQYSGDLNGWGEDVADDRPSSAGVGGDGESAAELRALLAARETDVQQLRAELALVQQELRAFPPSLRASVLGHSGTAEAVAAWAQTRQRADAASSSSGCSESVGAHQPGRGHSSRRSSRADGEGGSSADSALGADGDEEAQSDEGDGDNVPLRARASMAETKGEQQLLRLRQQVARNLAEKVSARMACSRLAGRGRAPEALWALVQRGRAVRRCRLACAQSVEHRLLPSSFSHRSSARPIPAAARPPLRSQRGAEENARMLRERLSEVHADLRELGSTLQTTSSKLAAAEAAGADAERRCELLFSCRRAAGARVHACTLLSRGALLCSQPAHACCGHVSSCLAALCSCSCQPPLPSQSSRCGAARRCLLARLPHAHRASQERGALASGWRSCDSARAAGGHAQPQSGARCGLCCRNRIGIRFSPVVVARH